MSKPVVSEAIEEILDKVALFEDDRDMDRFLKDAVTHIMKRSAADMGAVFVHDDKAGELILRAGIDNGDFWDRRRYQHSSAPLRFGLEGNDVGRAFSERRVIRVFVDRTDTDHPFRSKLLIPIIRGSFRYGVLALARLEVEGFVEEDEAGLLASASRLGDLLEDASALIESREAVKLETTTRTILGKKASDGQIEGTALPFWVDRETRTGEDDPAGDVASELARFETALTASLNQLEELQNKASSGDAEMVAMIFSAHLLMLKDVSFTNKMRQRIEDGEPAAQAVRAVSDEYAALFAKMTEVRLAEKAQDVRDLGYRLVTNIAGGSDEGFSYHGRIVLARHIYPSDLYRLAVEGVAGLVLRGSGVTAHISILARSLNLPVLITDDRALLDIPDGTQLLLDATRGRLHIDPDDTLRKEYRVSRDHVEDEPTSYHLKGRTADGIAVQVLANVNILKDAEDATNQGAEGIGLYRSEFPFILKNDFLSEEQQYRIYRSIVKSQSGKPVTLRTADIGGDKLLQGRGEAESNPFLGVRGIRFSLANREMFRDQLRAMLRAGEGADLGIMLPMVSGIEEVLEAKDEIRMASDSLTERGVSHNSSPRIGAMVELPSAAMAVADLAAETDFLSIGTNDLTMYLLAVDRTNENLSHLYRSHHPSVLRVLSAIVRYSGKKRGEISVCGDVAADPVLIPFFVGIGIRKLSVSPAFVEPVKRRLATFSLEVAKTISKELLAIKRLSKMEEYLADFGARYPDISD